MKFDSDKLNYFPGVTTHDMIAGPHHKITFRALQNVLMQRIFHNGF